MHVTSNYYKNILRWDILPKKQQIKKSLELPRIDKITLHMHEKFSQNSKDVYVLALCMECLTGQRVSPRIIEKGSYKLNLVSKKSRTSIHVQTTLRGKNLFNFLDKYTLGFPKLHLQENPFNKLFVCAFGNHSFYQTNLHIFESMNLLTPGLIKTGPLQININYK
jgi:ribosomal protein L5